MDRDTTRDDRFPTLLGATLMGVYLLVVSGTTTAVANGEAACHGWPACDGHLLVPPTRLALAVGWAHRAVVAVVAALLLLALLAALGRAADRRVLGALSVAALLYPVQVLVGRATALRGVPVALSALHLALAVGIFVGVLVALTWTLDGAGADGYGDELVRDQVPAADDSVAGAGESTPAEPHQDPTADPGALALAGQYLSLTKPRLMWLLCLVALAGVSLAVGAGATVSPVTVVATLVGGVLAIGASGTFNHVIERDRDARMDRTADRPLVDGTIPVRNALAFGVALAVLSVATFALLVNAVAAALGLVAIVFYSVVYTVVLKPNTSQNIVLGGAVGAFPALIGWAAATNDVGLPAVVLGALIFTWTPAHFYNLALAYEDDYARAGYPMLPVVRGEAVTRRHILGYLGATLLAAGALGAVSSLGWLYVATTLVFGGVFVWSVLRLHRDRTDRAAIQSFHASNAFLGALLVAVAASPLL